jgi:hypothetical protein
VSDYQSEDQADCCAGYTDACMHTCLWFMILACIRFTYVHVARRYTHTHTRVPSSLFFNVQVVAKENNLRKHGVEVEKPTYHELQKVMFEEHPQVATLLRLLFLSKATYKLLRPDGMSEGQQQSARVQESKVTCGFASIHALCVHATKPSLGRKSSGVCKANSRQWKHNWNSSSYWFES